MNGEKISKADFTRIYEGQFQQVALQAQMSGQELDQAQLKKQTAEGLVNTELLIQQAAKEKIFATPEGPGTGAGRCCQEQQDEQHRIPEVDGSPGA